MNLNFEIHDIFNLYLYALPLTSIVIFKIFMQYFKSFTHNEFAYIITKYFYAVFHSMESILSH